MVELIDLLDGKAVRNTDDGMRVRDRDSAVDSEEDVLLSRIIRYILCDVMMVGDGCAWHFNDGSGTDVFLRRYIWNLSDHFIYFSFVSVLVISVEHVFVLRRHGHEAGGRLG